MTNTYISDNKCLACGGLPCVYLYTHDRARSAERMGNDQEFLRAYRRHEKRLREVEVLL